jgi:putative thioredoxin
MEEAAAMPELEELAAAVEANSADLELKYQLAVRHVVAERYEESLLVGLEILQADRSFRDDLGRLTMIRVFDVLGKGNELAGQYRRKMFNLMH